MKRRFLSTLMALCLALSLLPTAAFAAGGDVAQVGDTTYATLKEAIEAAGTIYAESQAAVEITLLADVTTEEEMVFSNSGEYILNLDTHTFTSTDQYDVVEVRTGNIDLTIRNGSLIGQGDESYGIYVYRDSENNRSYDDVTITLDGVMLTTKDQGLGVQGLNSNQNLIVRNSSVSAATAIYFPPMSGSLLIENSTITGINNGIVIKGGSLTVRGNTTISASAEPVKQNGPYGGNVDGVGFPQTGAPIYVEGGYDAKGSSAPRPIEVTIENGTFNSGNGDSLLIGFTEAGGSQDIYVQGGDFNQGITNDGESDLIIANATVDGTVANTGNGTTSISSSIVESVGGGVRYYNSTIGGTAGQSSGDAVASVDGKICTTLSAAISDAGDGDTVTLLANVAESITIPKGKEIVLDLNGHTLTNTEGSHTITNNGELTVQDTSAGRTGTVDNVTHAKGALVNYGTAVLEGGTFTRSAEAGRSPSENGGNSWDVIDNPGEMTIDGAEVTSKGKYSSLIRNIKEDESEKGVLNVKSGSLSNGFIALKNDTGGTMDITGGTITSEDQAVQNWSEATISGGELTGKVYSWSAGEAPKNDTGNLTISGTARINGEVAAIQYQYTDKGGQIITPDTPAKVTIQGGTVLGQVTTDARSFDESWAPATKAKVTVSGGQFKEPVNEDYLDESLNAELKSAGNTEAPYSYYDTVEDALKAAKPGDNVTDLKATEENQVTLTLKYNDGVTADSKYTVTSGTKVTLPTPTRNGYDFRYWSNGSATYSGGATYTVIGSTTLTAQWSAKSQGGSSSGSSSTTYSPTLDVSDGGTIKVSPRTPEAGDKVTITPDPDNGYEVGEVTVTDRSGDAVRVTANRDGTYTFTQPRGRVTIEVTFVRAGESVFFDDVPAAFWAYDEIAWAYDNGYVNGTSATTFSPNSSITRQQVWMILARLSGADPASMAAAREWAMVNDISDGTNPGNAVTRQQLVALLYRYAQMMGYDNGAREALSSFPDAGTVSGYAQEPMQWSVANGIVAGTSAGTLNPTGTATRAQFAVILYRFWDQVG